MNATLFQVQAYSYAWDAYYFFTAWPPKDGCLIPHNSEVFGALFVFFLSFSCLHQYPLGYVITHIRGLRGWNK